MRFPLFFLVVLYCFACNEPESLHLSGPPIPDVLERCDVRADACAQTMVLAVAAAFDLPLPTSVVVRPKAVAPYDKPFPGQDWRDTIPWPNLIDTHGTVPESDWEELGTMPLPLGYGIYEPQTNTFHFHYPDDDDETGSASRRRLVGLVKSTADFLRSRSWPQHWVDARQYSRLQLEVANAISLAAGYWAFFHLEHWLENEPRQPDQSNIQPLLNTLWDTAITPPFEPHRFPGETLLITKSIVWLQNFLETEKRWEGVWNKLNDDSFHCPHEVMMAKTCVELQFLDSEPVVDGQALGAHALGVHDLAYIFGNDEDTNSSLSQVQHLNAHVARLFINHQRIIIKQEVFRWDSTAAADDFFEDVLELVNERASGPVVSEDETVLLITPELALLLERDGHNVYLVQGPKGTNLEQLVTDAKRVRVLEHK